MGSDSQMRRLGALSAVLVAAAGVVVAVPSAAAATEQGAVRAPSIEWGACRTYSDDVIEEQAPGGDVAAFKRVLRRLECGTLTAPLDYGSAQGRRVTIALTRLRATEPATRVGVLAINPGGPGASGVLTPAQIALTDVGGVAKRFDLIGFDPRGIGDSTPRLVCGPALFNDLTVDKAEARQNNERQASANRRCAATDPGLIASLTTTNIARDLDRIRAGLGERKLNYLGFSWGTGLGAAYRTEFPQRAGRLVLDSVDNPLIRLDVMDDDIAAAKEINHRRFAAWLAEHERVFRLGKSQAAVEAQIRRIRKFFTQHPQDVPGIQLVDEITVALISTQISLDWPAAARDLVTLKKIVDAGPPAVAARSKGERSPRLEPEFDNEGVFVAVDCNADTGLRDFESWFTRWEQRRVRYPVAGVATPPSPRCAGWPQEPRPTRYADGGTDVLLVEHTFEDVTPVRWARDMAARVGGVRLAVDDDVHASLPDTACAKDAVAFLISGTRPPAQCAGLPVPGPEVSPAGAQAPLWTADARGARPAA